MRFRVVLEAPGREPWDHFYDAGTADEVLRKAQRGTFPGAAVVSVEPETVRETVRRYAGVSTRRRP